MIVYGDKCWEDIKMSKKRSQQLLIQTEEEAVNYLFSIYIFLKAYKCIMGGIPLNKKNVGKAKFQSGQIRDV